MPIYEYQCQACGTQFEKIVFGSSPSVVCTTCGSERVERKPSTFGMAGVSRDTGGGSNCGGCKRSSCAGCH